MPGKGRAPVAYTSELLEQRLPVILVERAEQLTRARQVGQQACACVVRDDLGELRRLGGSDYARRA